MIHQLNHQAAWARGMRLGAVGAMSLLALSAAGCDSGASAVAKGDKTATADVVTGSSGPALATSGGVGGGSERGAAGARPVRLVDGKPAWAATRRLSAEDAAQANFERNAADFGVSSVEAWITAVHDFVEHPPRGVQRISRANGDTLLYDPKANVFAVVTRDGAPRTMFKPSTGAAYWEEQKAGASTTRASAGSGARRSADNG
jgi:pyocin large subunit-like protein